MKTIKVMQICSLYIPGYIEEKELKARIEKATRKDILYRLGKENAYSLYIIEEGKPCATIFSIENIINENNIHTTKICYRMDGLRENDIDIFFNESSLMTSIIEEFKGLVVFEYITNLANEENQVHYTTTYAKDSEDHRLISKYLEELLDPEEAMVKYQSLKSI